jgi:hypothetical protein
MAKIGIGIRLEQIVVDAVKAHAESNHTNVSRTIEFILCRYFDIQLNTAEQMLAEKEAEIERLKQELEAVKRRQRLATVSDLNADKFTIENG